MEKVWYSSDSLDVNLLASDGQALALHVYFLLRIYRQRWSNPLELSDRLIRGASAMAKLVTGMHDRLCKAAIPRGLPNDVLRTKHTRHASSTAFFRVLARTFSSLKHGLCRLSQMQGGREAGKAVSFSFIQMFDDLLETITHSRKANQSENRAEDTSASESSLVSVTGEDSLRKQTNQASIKWISHQTLQLVQAMLSYLDHSDAIQRDLFEGFMFVILERAGNYLFSYSFGVPRKVTIEKDIEIEPRKLPFKSDSIGNINGAKPDDVLNIIAEKRRQRNIQRR